MRLNHCATLWLLLSVSLLISCDKDHCLAVTTSFESVKSDVGDHILTDYETINAQLEDIKTEGRGLIAELGDSERKQKKCLNDVLSKVEDYRKQILFDRQSFDEIERLSAGRHFQRVQKERDYLATFPQGVKRTEVSGFLLQDLRNIKVKLEEHVVVPEGLMIEPITLSMKANGVLNYLHSQDLVSSPSGECLFASCSERIASIIQMLESWRFTDAQQNGIVTDIRGLLDDFHQHLAQTNTTVRAEMQEALDAATPMLTSSSNSTFRSDLERAATRIRAAEDLRVAPNVVSHGFVADLPADLKPLTITPSTATDQTASNILSFEIPTRVRLTNDARSVKVEVIVTVHLGDDCQVGETSYDIIQPS